MSQLLQGATRGGESIVAFHATDPPEYFWNGLPYDRVEGTPALAIELGPVAGIDHYHQGLPFTAVGRLAIDSGKPVAYYGSGAAPFSDLSLIDLAVGAVDHYSAGIPYTVGGQVEAVVT